MFEPAQYIFDCECAVPSSVYSSNEFVHRAPKDFNSEAVVITCSHSGNTPETVKASEIAKEKGALTICFTHLKDSPLWDAAEYQIHYNWSDESDASDYNNAALYALTFNILNELTPCEKFDKALTYIDQLPAIFDRNTAKYLEAADKFGSTHKRESLIYTMASGAHYGVAYSFAICLLMEMQWVHSHAIHSGEYFHGPFEVTDYDVPFIIIKGLDNCRPLDERAYNFCKKYSQKITLIDAADYDMHEIDDSLKGYFAPLVTNVVLRKFADAIADHRGHPLSVRRYMWRMEY